MNAKNFFKKSNRYYRQCYLVEANHVWIPPLYFSQLPLLVVLNWFLMFLSIKLYFFDCLCSYKESKFEISKTETEN